MLKKFPLDIIKGTKNVLFFRLRFPTHHSFTSNLQYELKHKVRLSKSVCGIFHFWFRFVLLKLIFLFNKTHVLFDFKISFNFFENSRKATHSFVPRPLTFKLQQDVSKSNDICVSWSSPKADLVTNFLNLKNWSFEDVSFSQ